jgi:WD40 repeat protein
MELNVPEYKAKLYYHNSRPPNEEMVKKICESLDLARDIVNDAQTKLSYALIDPKLHSKFQARRKDAFIPDIRVAQEAARHHFLVNAPSSDDQLDAWKRIMTVIKDTLDGLDAVNADVTLSDVLSQYRWDLYKVYGEAQSWDKAREQLTGEFRPEREDQPTADKARSGYVLFKEHTLEGYVSARFSPDEQWVVTVSEDESVQVWNAATRQAVGQPIQPKGAVDSARFSPDGRWVVTASRDQTQVWDAATGESVGQPMQHEGHVCSAQFSPDGKCVVTGSEDGKAQVWDAATGKALGKRMEHPSAVYSAQFSPDGQRVVTGSEDGKAQVWDTATGKAVGQPMQHTRAVDSAQFSPNGKWVVTASRDKTAQVWDAETGESVGQPMQHKGAVYSAQFSPDGQRVVTASDDETAQVWDAATGKPVGQPMQHEDAVHSARFSLDGNQVVTAAEDKMRKERVWDAATGKALGELDGPVYFTEMKRMPKGIHIEFSNVTEYPRLLLALVIVHEATHKFADTEDHAYTDDDDYKKLTMAQRIENADSFAYVVISIALDQLIKDLEEFLKAVPRNDQRGPKAPRDWPKDILGRAEKRSRKL